MADGWARWLCVPRAALELARARLALRRIGAAQVHAMKREGAAAALTPACARRVAQVRWAIPRVAARLPWRGDCLVQALAARAWLEGEGIATSLELGAAVDPAQGFAAHAWLRAGDEAVTGGDSGDYAAFSSRA